MHKNTTVADRASKITGLKIQDLGRRAVAERLGCSEKQARYALEYLRNQPAEPPKPEKPKPPRISSIDIIDADLVPGKVHRFIVSAAQDDTLIFKPFVDNLLAYCDAIKAQFFVGPFTYQKGLFEDHAAQTAVYDPALREYLCPLRVVLNDRIMFIGDANVLPTSANPLNGWMTTYGGQHVIVPHARVALQSIPRPQDEPARFAVSTGCCTIPSYAPRASGRKSIARHTYAALLVEIDVDGEVFFRHLVANADDGSFQDLTHFVKDGIVYDGCRVGAIAWGDIHYEQLDPVVARTAFGFCVDRKKVVTTDSIYERLRPEVCFYHDTLDFRRRNHHSINDPHLMAEVYVSGKDNVEDEVRDAAHFINEMHRDWCISVVVESNHDAAICRWTKNKEGQTDPANAYYWHEMNAAWHNAIRKKDRDFNLVEFAMRKAGLRDDVPFVASGGTYLVYGVDYGHHGDIGIGGARGTPRQFTRMGRKMTTEHTHAPSIHEDVHTGGLSARKKQGYNKGPTAWAFGHSIGYCNGTRAMLIQSDDGRYCALG
jgi:hypothetical protein